MQTADQTPPLTRADLRARPAAPAPVFVDGSGRRLRRVRTAALSGLALLLVPFAVVTAAMLGAPTVVSPLLPEPIAAPAPEEPPLPTAEPSASPRPSQAVVAAPAAPVAPAATPVPVASPTAAPAPVPTPAPSAAVEDPRGSSATAPGRADKPAPTPPGKP